VDLVRLGKAIIKDIFALRLKEGASTITQQLARNLYLGHSDRNVFDGFTRKIREFLTSVQLEQTFTKDEILEFYLNVVYFGRGSYGIASASQAYFGKAPADLTLGEVATLIAVLKGPAYYDPTGKHPERALNRRNTVLSQMLKYRYITDQQAEQARAEVINIKPADEFTAAGIVMQAEHLLISRDRKAVDHYLPMLERCANFIETRRDPANNCFLAGPAGTLAGPVNCCSFYASRRPRPFGGVKGF